jgi:hypothetical protein
VSRRNCLYTRPTSGAEGERASRLRSVSARITASQERIGKEGEKEKKSGSLAAALQRRPTLRQGRGKQKATTKPIVEWC